VILHTLQKSKTRYSGGICCAQSAQTAQWHALHTRNGSDFLHRVHDDDDMDVLWFDRVLIELCQYLEQRLALCPSDYHIVVIFPDAQRRDALAEMLRFPVLLHQVDPAAELNRRLSLVSATARNMAYDVRGISCDELLLDSPGKFPTSVYRDIVTPLASCIAPLVFGPPWRNLSEPNLYASPFRGGLATRPFRHLVLEVGSTRGRDTQKCLVPPKDRRFRRMATWDYGETWVLGPNMLLELAMELLLLASSDSTPLARFKRNRLFEKRVLRFVREFYAR
jgi:hypothetical protein